MLKSGIDAIPHSSRSVNNNLYPFEKSDNAHFCVRSGSEADVISKSEPINPADDHFPFVDSCLPHVKAFSYVWFHLQAAKRQYFKKCERKMPLEEELKLKNKLQSELQETKQRWATRLLAKLRKDIDAADREKLAYCLSESSRNANSSSQAEGRPLPCVLSIADLKGKMRRIDCLRQADKVWRLDIVLAVLFRAVPLESTDGERVEKSLGCRQPLLCVNPYHLNVGVRELDMFLSNYLFNFEIPVSFLNAPKANQAQFVAVTDGVYSRCVFGARELLELSQMPINSDGRAFPSSTASSNTNMGGSVKQQVSVATGKPQSAFKPLLSGGVTASRMSAKDLDHVDCDKDEGASDEEVASLSLGPQSGHASNWRASDNSAAVNCQTSIRGAVAVRQQQQQQAINNQSGGRTGHQQQANCYPSSSSVYNSTTNSATQSGAATNSSVVLSNRVVVVPSHGMASGTNPASLSAAHHQHSFQPIRSSPPVSSTSVASFVKTEIPSEDDKNVQDSPPDEALWRTRNSDNRAFSSLHPGNSNSYVGGNLSASSAQNRQNSSDVGRTGTGKLPQETGSDRLEDFANYVVEAASRSNSPVRKQPRLSLDALVSSSGDFDIGNNGHHGSTTSNTPYQAQPILSGISSPSLMMHAGIGLLPMINGMQQTMAAAVAGGNSSVPPPPPPTHPLLYSPNPFSLFSSPAITPRTTPRSTPVPNAQSTIAAAVAVAAAQFGADSSDAAASADRERQLQLAAGLFEQNLRVFGLLGAVSGPGNNSGSSLFRSPGFSGFGGLASGIGSALVSGADTGNAGQTTPSIQRSPTREMADAATATAQDDDELPQQRPPGTFDGIWSVARGQTVEPQISGQTHLSTSSSSGDDAFQSSSQTDNTKSDRCKPNLLLQSTNVEEKV